MNPGRVRHARDPPSPPMRVLQSGRRFVSCFEAAFVSAAPSHSPASNPVTRPRTTVTSPTTVSFALGG